MELYQKLFLESPISICLGDGSDCLEYLNKLQLQDVKDYQRYFAEHAEFVDECLSLFKILDVNKAILELFKAKDKGALYDYLTQVMSKEMRSVFREAMIAVAENKSDFRKEINIHTLSGSERHIVIECYFSGLTKGGANSSLVPVIVTDVTESIKAREELQRRNDQLHSLFNAMAEGLVMIDRSGQIVSANPMAETILGLKHPEIVSRNYISSKWQIIRPDGSPMPPEEMAGPLAMRTKKPVKNVVMGVVKPDNTIRWINVNASPVINASGEFEGVVGTFADITEKIEKENEVRSSQEKLSALFQAIPIPTYTWQKKGNDFVLIDFNHAAEEITRGKVKKYIGTKASKLHKNEPAILNEINECYQKKKNIQREMSFEYKELGEIKYLAVKYSYVPPDLVVVYTEDITERQKIETELKELNEQLKGLTAYLQTAREEERAFIGREIHDQLGQILTTLKMDLFLLGLKIPKADTEKKRLTISYEIKSMLKHVDHLIQTAHNLVAKLKPGNLDILDLQAAIELHTSDFLRSTGIKFKIRSNVKKIDLDKKQALEVFRIFEECLTNVVRHAEATRVDIRLQQKPDHFFLTVKDNGNGLAGDKMSGAGSFGLIGMRERALSLGGDLAIDSVVGKGTSVMFRIPLQEKRNSN